VATLLVAKQLLREQQIPGLTPQVVGSRMPQFVHFDTARQSRPLQAQLEPAVDGGMIHRPRAVVLRVEQILPRPTVEQVHLKVALERVKSERKNYLLSALAVDERGRGSDLGRV
jgi:hypothetical protein